MDRVTRYAAELVRRSVRALPAERRGWGEAVVAEATEVPAGRARLSWLLGGLWLVVRQARVTLVSCVAVGSVSVAVVSLGWSPGSTNPAAPVNRVYLLATVVMLAALPLLGRRRGLLGPAGDNRTVRLTGYLAVWVLQLVMVVLGRFSGARFEHFQAFDQDNWNHDVVTGAITGSLLLFALTAAYAIAMLATTARRSTIPPATLSIGAGCGLAAGVVAYALTPLGSPLHFANYWLSTGVDLLLLSAILGTPVAAGRLAARHRGNARIAGLWTGMVAALVATNLTITTMLLMPRAVPLSWANPDPSAPHGTPFEIQMTVGDTAGNYVIVLILGPLVGLIVGGAVDGRQSRGLT